MMEIVTNAITELAARGVLPRDLAARSFDAATKIDELGLDSLGKLELLSELEERADVTLSESMLPGLRTLGDLASVLAGLRP